jgi:hypothetical protein
VKSPQTERKNVSRETYSLSVRGGPGDDYAHIDTGDVVEPAANIEFASQVPLSRLLLRLKLGSSRSGGQDPLL